jgi:DNA-binding IclR family transcriptional regulator
MQQPDDTRAGTESTSRWTFLTNHAHVLLTISSDPGIRARDIAQRVGITERAAQRIVAELEAAGYLTRWREGRRNRYEVHRDVRLRHPVEQEHDVGELLRLLAPVGPDA